MENTLREPSMVGFAQASAGVCQCPMCHSRATRAKFVKVHAEERWTLRQCRNCGLHFTDPVPSAEFLARCYAGDYHEGLRTDGGTEHHLGAKYQRYVNRIAQHLPLGSRVLDVGCSTGLLVKMLCDQGYRAEGIELNPASAAWGRQHYGITIHERAIEQGAFASDSFDAIILADVLEHTLHPRDCLSAIGQSLRPDGIALVTFPDVTSLESRWFFLMSKMTSTSWLWKNCHIPLHIWEFTPRTAVACFEGAGFRLIDLQRSQDVPEEDLTGLLKLISFPSKVVAWPAVARRWGTQMEFLIRRNG